MPTYEYVCRSCDYRFEKWQKMTDAPLEVCPECGGHVRRVFYPAGIVFKGSGFYSTDHSASSSAASNGHNHKHEENAAATSEAASESATSSAGASETKSEKKVEAPASK